MKKLACLLLLVAVAAFGQEAEKKATPKATPKKTAAKKKAAPKLGPGAYATFQTSMGKIVCRLYEKEAPETVKNFIGLAEGTKEWTHPASRARMKVPLYSGTFFHRVIPGFMIQGGDPIGNGQGNPGYRFADEFVPGLTFNVPGRLAMANSGPNSNGSQFFITEVPTPHLNNIHTIFGQVVEGQELVGKIARSANKVTLEKVIIMRVK